MSVIEQVGLLFFIGSIAGFLNVMAGGGSTLTLPALIFLGLDGAMANGTNRVAIFVQNIFAISSFRQQDVHHFSQSFLYSLWTLPGALIGAFVAIRIQDAWFQKILAVIMVGIVISMFIPRKMNEKKRTQDSGISMIWRPISLLGIGFYGGFVQVGVGFLLMAALYHIFRYDLIRVNMHKVFIVFIYTIPALAIFVLAGKVNWELGLSLAAGNAIGGWWAARVAVRKGEKIVRIVLGVAIVLMAAKLMGLY